MQGPDTTLFTPTEAAVLTQLSVKAVNNAIDKKTIPAQAGRQGESAVRLLDLRALMSLTLERRLADRVMPELRRQIFAELAGARRDRLSLDGGFLTIDLREPRRELARSLRTLRRARTLVVTDPDTLGGTPVFRGTRIPVHLIATLLEEGGQEAELRQSYPRLTPEMIALAPIYATAYPQRGRPRAQPWHGHAPILRTRRKLDALEAG